MTGVQSTSCSDDLARSARAVARCGWGGEGRKEESIKAIAKTAKSPNMSGLPEINKLFSVQALRLKKLFSVQALGLNNYSPCRHWD